MIFDDDFKLAYCDETALAAGGSGGSKNTPTELVLADLAAIDMHTEFNSPIPKVQRERLFALGQGLHPVKIATVQTDVGVGNGTAYLQTDTLYNWAMSPTKGSPGTTKAFRYNTDDQRDLYGCYVTDYSLVCTNGKPIFQEYSFEAAQAKLTGCTDIADTGIPAFSTAAIQMWDACAFTIDSHTISNLNLKSLTYKIENTWVDDEDSRDMSSDTIIEKALLERRIEITLDFLSDNSNTWIADLVNTALQEVTATLNFGLFTLTLDGSNELYLSDETRDEITERGVIPRTAMFESSTGFSPVKS